MSLSVLDEYLAGQRQATRVVVSVSGGKDSIAMLLEVLETVPREPAYHQIVLEHWPGLEYWPGAVEYCETVCRRLQVPLYCTQARYSGYECLECYHRYLVSCATLSILWCRADGSC